MKTIKHIFRRGGKINTAYGIANIDQDGYVTNLVEIGKEHPHLDIDEAFAKLPNFVDAEVFKKDMPPANPIAFQDPPTMTAPQPVQNKPQTEPPPAHAPSQYYNVIKELLQAGAKVNSEGYIDMEELGKGLRERNLPIISGSRRIAITNEGRKMDAFAADLQKKPQQSNIT